MKFLKEGKCDYEANAGGPCGFKHYGGPGYDAAKEKLKKELAGGG